MFNPNDKTMAIALREKKIAGGKVSLYLDVYHEGRRWYEFLGIHINSDKPTLEDKTKRRLAHEIKIKRENGLIVEEYGLLDKDRKQTDFISFYEHYLTTKKPNSNLTSTLYQLNQFADKKSLPIIKITAEWFKGFERFLLKSVENNTALCYLKNVSSALNELVRRKVIVRNPWFDIPPHERLKKKAVGYSAWTLEQLQQLANTPCNIEVQFKLAYLFSCFTGLRWSDVNGLMWGNIIRNTVNNCEEWFVQFEQQKTKATECFPLSEQAVEILRHRKAEQGNSPSLYIFPNAKETDERNKTVQSRVNYGLKKWAKVAGLDPANMSFHTSRHSYATNLLESGVDIYTVSKLLGHKSFQTTQIYAHVRDRMKQAAVRALPTINMFYLSDSSLNKEAA